MDLQAGLSSTIFHGILSSVFSMVAKQEQRSNQISMKTILWYSSSDNPGYFRFLREKFQVDLFCWNDEAKHKSDGVREKLNTITVKYANIGERTMHFKKKTTNEKRKERKRNKIQQKYKNAIGLMWIGTKAWILNVIKGESVWITKWYKL